MWKSATSTIAAAIVLAASAALAPQTSQAQSYPDKSIRLIVPYAPGGATDIIGRATAEELTKTLGHFNGESIFGLLMQIGFLHGASA